MTDTLPEVTLTMEQEARACDMATAMSQKYWGNFSCARLIVRQQDRIAELETREREAFRLANAATYLIDQKYSLLREMKAFMDGMTSPPGELSETTGDGQ